MSLNTTSRLRQWAPILGSVLLLATANIAAAAASCNKLVNPGDFAAYLKPLNKVTQIAQDICYAEATSWMEKNTHGPGNVSLIQRFDYYRPATAALSQPLPLVIWAHPSGQTEAIPAGETRFKQLVEPAIAQGFAFMSIEFRHPVGSQLKPPATPNLDIPNTDVARAVQWARAWAGDLGVDPKNVFLIGQSRGTLGLLTALAPDQADNTSPVPYLQQSSRVNAVYAAQAQTSYEKDQIRKTFIHPDDWQKFTNQYPDFHQPGSAIFAMSTDDPPVAMRYERAPTDPALKTVIPLHLANDDGSCSDLQNGCFDEHHPNFGLKLALAFKASYVNAGQKPPASKFDIAYNVPEQYYFVDQLTGKPYVCFFVKNLTADALANQTPSALAGCGL